MMPRSQISQVIDRLGESLAVEIGEKIPIFVKELLRPQRMQMGKVALVERTHTLLHSIIREILDTGPLPVA